MALIFFYIFSSIYIIAAVLIVAIYLTFRFYAVSDVMNLKMVCVLSSGMTLISSIALNDPFDMSIWTIIFIISLFNYKSY